MEWTEELGFDEVWLTEHHFIDYGLAVDPAALAAAAASRTRRVRIGLAAAILPFHHPLRLAEQMALIDIISERPPRRGRRPRQPPAEFRGYHVPQQENRERFDEAVEILQRRGPRSASATHGRFFTIPRRAYPEAAAAAAPADLPGVRQRRTASRATARARLADAQLRAVRPRRAARGNPRHLRDRAGEARAAPTPRSPRSSALGRVPPDLRGRDATPQALADARDAEMWYQDSFRRFVIPERIEDAHPSLQPGFRAMAERLDAVTWDDLVARDARVRLARHRGPAHRDDAAARRRPGALLDELRRPRPGQDPPLDGAVRPRSHAPLPLGASRLSVRRPRARAVPHHRRVREGGAAGASLDPGAGNPRSAAFVHRDRP